MTAVGCGTALPTRAPAESRHDGVLIEDWPRYAQPPSAGAGPNGLPAGFRERFAFRELAYPTSLAFLPDGRALVAEQRGVIKMFTGIGDSAPVTLLDHRSQVFFRIHQGLIGLAVDPDFEREPYIYVLYAFAGPPGAAQPSYGSVDVDADECPGAQGASCAVGARLSRFRFVDPQTLGAEQVLVDGWCGSSPFHSVGDIAWAPDGTLLAGVGDSAQVTPDFGHHGNPPNVCGDPPVAAGTAPSAPSAEGGSLRSQDLRTRGDPVGLNGAIIRVDRATGEAVPGNPLSDDRDANAQRIVAYGLRNPYRFEFRPGTAELWVVDVGWQRYEELNLLDLDTVEGPPNYGWPCYEGPFAEPDWQALGVQLCDSLYGSEPPELTFPAFSFGRPEEGATPCLNGGAALSAIAFYDGASFPSEYRGALFLGDHQLRCTWVMSAGPDGRPDHSTVRQFRAGAGPIDFEVGPEGALYYVDTDQAVHVITYEPR